MFNYIQRSVIKLRDNGLITYFLFPVRPKLQAKDWSLSDKLVQKNTLQCLLSNIKVLAHTLFFQTGWVEHQSLYQVKRDLSNIDLPTFRKTSVIKPGEETFIKYWFFFLLVSYLIILKSRSASFSSSRNFFISKFCKTILTVKKWKKYIEHWSRDGTIFSWLVYVELFEQLIQMKLLKCYK